MDRYIARQVAGGYAAVLVAIVAMLALENAGRMAAAMQHVERPFALLGWSMASLLPEFLGVGIPLATYLGTALAIRRLALRGEWQIFAAIGVRPARMMCVPVAFALLAAGAQLGIRFELQPRGERQIDGLLMDIGKGLYGLSFTPGQVAVLDPNTTILAERPRKPGPGRLGQIFFRRGKDVVVAANGHVALDRNGNIQLTMRSGTLVHRQPDGELKAGYFEALEVGLSAPQIPIAFRNAAERMDRMTTSEIAALARRERATHTQSYRALPAMMARTSSAMVCLVLPWLALALAVPPPRKAGGPALLIGIVFYVAFLKTSAMAEDAGGQIPILLACLHLIAWCGLTAGLLRFASLRGNGALDTALASLVSKTRGPFVGMRQSPSAAFGGAVVADAKED